VPGARHGDGINLVLQAVIGLVLDGRVGGLFAQVLVHAAALDHEAVDDAVEDRAVVLALLDVLQEVVDRDRGFFRVQLDGDVAHAGFQQHAGRVGGQHGEASVADRDRAAARAAGDDEK
jgi:hypothetical protein